MPTVIPHCGRHTLLGTKSLLFHVNHTYQNMYALNFAIFFPSNFCTMKSFRTKRKERFPAVVRELRYRLSLLKKSTVHTYIIQGTKIF